MKTSLVILCSCLVVSTFAQRDRHQQQDQQQYQDDNQQQQQYSTKQQQQQPRENSIDRDKYTTPIPIVRFDKEQGSDGSYKTSYETGNHIIAEETGFIKNIGEKDTEALVQHGSYSYTAPDGQLITVTYTADEQGFRASGDHLPTPPPVPAEIQKSLDLIYEGIRQQEEEDAREQKFQKQAPEQISNNDNYPGKYGQ